MAYNYEYPHFDACNYNSDWLINKMKELEETVIGLETFRYIGENEILDLNQQKQNSIAAFTSNFNALNSPVSNVQRITVTYGSESAYIQQLYDLSNFTVYTRNYSTSSGWTAWKMTQNKPGTNLHTTPMLNSGDLNDMVPNSATIANGNAVQNAPRHNWGFVITWNSDGSADKIQLWFDMINSFCYIRFANPTWNAWVELNHIDLTSYLKSINVYTTGDDLNNLPKNRVAVVLDKAANIPINGNFHVMSLGSPNSNDQMQIALQRGSNEIWLRTNNTGVWVNITRNYKVLHRLDNITLNDVYGASFTNGYFPEYSTDPYMAAIGIGWYSSTADTYQLLMSSSNNLYSRFRNNGSWSSFALYQHTSSSRALIASALPIEYSTDNEGRERTMICENIYSEAAKVQNTSYISLPGQSLLHSDEGKQSFKDAILASDLSDTDVIMTNLEMWDMDIPLDTIAEEVAALSDAITAKNPMCELTLLSIPPIDIPLWGDELLDYTMPNGSTLRQVDDRLFRLSEEHPFNYVSFEYFYDAQNANLMEYLGEDFKTNKQYLRRVGSFIKNTI